MSGDYMKTQQQAPDEIAADQVEAYEVPVMKKQNDNIKKLYPVALLTGTVIIFALLLHAVSANERNKSIDISEKCVLVEVEGRSLYAVPLSEDKSLIVNSKGGTNKVLISGGKASVSEADCKNRICVNSKPISEVGESIVCLPHRVVVSIILNPSLENH